jgi:hypothetical protein
MTDDFGKDVKENQAAMRAMQTGVAALMRFEPAETQPKHLRVGVNNALAGVDALVALLIETGIITPDEFIRALTNELKIKTESYREQLVRHAPAGTKITLV